MLVIFGHNVKTELKLSLTTPSLVLEPLSASPIDRALTVLAD